MRDFFVFCNYLFTKILLILLWINFSFGKMHCEQFLKINRYRFEQAAVSFEKRTVAYGGFSAFVCTEADFFA